MNHAQLASDQGLRAEERKACEVVAGCEDMLAEMALIDAVERDGAKQADVLYAKADQVWASGGGANEGQGT